MTFFEVEQMEEFLHSLERHLDGWLLGRQDMQRMLEELNLLDKKLRKAGSAQKYPANLPAFCDLVEDLRHRADHCRSSICERLRV